MVKGVMEMHYLKCVLKYYELVHKIPNMEALGLEDILT
jgi:hypothetical protein